MRHLPQRKTRHNAWHLATRCVALGSKTRGVDESREVDKSPGVLESEIQKERASESDKTVRTHLRRVIRRDRSANRGPAYAGRGDYRPVLRHPRQDRELGPAE